MFNSRGLGNGSAWTNKSYIRSRLAPRCQSKNSNSYRTSKNLHGRCTLEGLQELTRYMYARGLAGDVKELYLKKRTETSFKKFFYNCIKEFAKINTFQMSKLPNLVPVYKCVLEIFQPQCCSSLFFLQHP